MNVLYYLLGAGGCIVWRWMNWLKKQPAGTPMRNFWRERLPTNVSSLVVSLLMMGAYLTGALHAAFLVLLPDDMAIKLQPMYTEGWAAPIAGFAITFAARKIVERFADKIGETEEK